MKNYGLFSTLFIEDVKADVELDDSSRGRMATLGQAWRDCKKDSVQGLWDSFIKRAVGFLEFVPENQTHGGNLFPLYEDWGFSDLIAIICVAEPGSDLDDVSIGRFMPGKLVGELKRRKLNWGILTNGETWRLYSLKTSKPYEDYVELPLGNALKTGDEAEYALFEHFFHKDCFAPELPDDDEADEEAVKEGVYRCRLDNDMQASEQVLDEWVKQPLLRQVDEILQYVCNGFIADTHKSGEEYTEEERAEIFESAVKFLYRCLFLFYAEARKLLPSEEENTELYAAYSIRTLCKEAHKFKWGKRTDTDGYDLWKQLKGLVQAINEGDKEYGVPMGYNGGLFDDEQEPFLGGHQLRNDFIARALYLLAYVEPFDANPDDEYEIPYNDLEVRHLGEMYENILEFNVMLADADRIRRRTPKGGIELLLASETSRKSGDVLIKKGEVFFGESALDRKQSGSYYTPESLVAFLNQKAIVAPLREKFESDYRPRFDELLKQMESGFDSSSRAGAGRSVLALLDRFVNEEVLQYTVCDPAMGSGHFLVNAANQMADLVVGLYCEIPDLGNLSVEGNCLPNTWRRLVTRHCVYGVDMNPLAVHLGKLSLWLNSFARDHKLTFLDHHLHHGNSLIGIRTLDQLKSVPKRTKDKAKKTVSEFSGFGELFDHLDGSAIRIAKIAEVDEDDTDQMRAIYEEARDEANDHLAPLADLYTAYLMDRSIDQDTYRQIYNHISRTGSIDGIGNIDCLETWQKVGQYRDWHHFFHWALAFPQIMQRGGFSATVGNPPWDIVKPNSPEFFLDYDPAFRTYKKQQANRVSTRLMDENDSIREKWEEHCGGIAEQSTYFKEPHIYSSLGTGDINTYKLFLEQFFALLQADGRMGIVVPSGIYIDQGCQPLRKRFLESSQIECVYCFENRRAIFNIHRSFKFVLFSTRKGGKTKRFKCAFMKHDPARLSLIEANALEMSTELVRKFSPKDLSILEFASSNEVNVAKLLASNMDSFGRQIPGKRGFMLLREFDMSGDSHLFHETPATSRMPLYEGGVFWHYDSEFGAPRYFIEEQNVREKLPKRIHSSDWQSCDDYKLVFRAIASPTNQRTLTTSILPIHVVCNHNVSVVQTAGISLHPYETILSLMSIANSFLLDWYVRIQGSTYLKFQNICDLPLPPKCPDTVSYDYLIARAARLLCTTPDMGALWAGSFGLDWTSTEFWYPSTGNMDYGPANEQKIRQRLAESAKSLTPEWTAECGVHDRLPDRRDTGDRAQLRAEIDAYVAHLYGLSRDDFSYILDTFPGHKKKDEKAFGEFMSKRKCLEEYDRLVPILNAEVGHD